MKTSVKVAILTAIVTIVAFPLEAAGPLGSWWASIWPWGQAPHGPAPTGLQVPLFMVLGVLEAVGLGLAISFLVFGWPVVKRVAATRPGAMAMYVSAAWVLGNWWIHDSLHFTNSTDPGSLLAIEYAFHVTLILAGATLCFQLFKSGTTGRLAPNAA